MNGRADTHSRNLAPHEQTSTTKRCTVKDTLPHRPLGWSLVSFVSRLPCQAQRLCPVRSDTFFPMISHTEFLYCIWQFGTGMRGKKNTVSIVMGVHFLAMWFQFGKPS